MQYKIADDSFTCTFSSGL